MGLPRGASSETCGSENNRGIYLTVSSSRKRPCLYFLVNWALPGCCFINEIVEGTLDMKNQPPVFVTGHAMPP